MFVTGKYTMDSNFTTVYADNTMYVIASNGNWSSVAVGQRMATGGILTQELYSAWEAECNHVGTFTLA